MQLAEALQPEGLSPGEQGHRGTSDGIPLCIEELVRRPGKWWLLRHAAPVRRCPMRWTSHWSLASCRRPPAVAVAGAAATIGRELDRAVLDATLDLSPEQIDRELDALAARLILVTTNQRGDKYRFRHELLAASRTTSSRRRCAAGCTNVWPTTSCSGPTRRGRRLDTRRNPLRTARRPEQAATAYADAAIGRDDEERSTQERTQLGRASS